MYKISSDYTKVIYSGGAEHNLYFKYGDSELIDASPYVSSLQSSRRLLDNGSKNFHLDNFVSQSIDLIIHDFELDDLKKEFYFELGTLVNGEYENVPIGYFKIKDNPTTTNGKITLKLMDRATNFDFNYDGSEVINANGGKASYKQIILDICSKANIELATPDFPRCDETTGLYDSTIMARVHIMYIAERSSCIPIMGRDGKLYFIPIVKENNNAIEIPEEIINEKFENADRFKISKVVYDSGVTLWTAGDDTADTLYINSSNPYIYNEEDIINIYNDVKDFEVYSINTNTLIGNIAIDPWDFVKFKITNDEGEVVKEIITLGQYDFTFNGKQRQTFDTQIDRLAKATNKTVTGEVVRYKRLKQTIDETNAKLTIVSEDVDGNKERIGQLELSSEGFKTSISNVEKGLLDTNKKVEGLETNLNGLSTSFNDFKDNEYVKDKQYIQDQIDGAIQFWNGSDIPTLNNFPANEWETEADKNNHRADIYTVIDDSSTPPKQGKSYRFDKVNGVWQWVELTDNELSAVQALAQQALDKSTQNEKDIGVLNKKTSELEQTDSEIRASVEELNNQYEQDVTLVKTASGDNSIYIEDANEDNAIEYHIFGKSEQETSTEGKNKWNYFKLPDKLDYGTFKVTNNFDGSLTISGEATTFTNNANFNFEIATGEKAKNMFKPGKITLAIYDKTTGKRVNSIRPYPHVNFRNSAGQIKEINSDSTSFTLTQENIDSEGFKILAGIYVNATDKATLGTYQVMLFQNNGDENYEPFTPNMPSLDFPSEIKSVSGIRNLWNGHDVTDIKNRILNDNGEEISDSTGGYTTNYTLVDSNKTYTFSNLPAAGANRIYYYDSNKKFISRSQAFQGPKTLTFTTPNNCKYINFQIYTNTTNDYNNWVLEEGTIAHTSVPFGSWLPVNVTGANILNYPNTYSNKFQEYWAFSINVPEYTLKKDTTYYFSVEAQITQGTCPSIRFLPGSQSNNAFTWSYLDKPNLNANFQRYSFSVIPKEDFTITNIVVQSNGASTSPEANIKFQNFMISEKDVPYEPYKSQQILIDMNKPNLFYGELEQGGLANNGMNSDSTNRIRTKNFFAVKESTKYLIKIDSYTPSDKILSISVDYYDTNDYNVNRLSYLALTNLQNNIMTFTTPAKCKYIRFIIAYTDSSDIIPSNVNNIVLYEGTNDIPYYELSSIDDTRDELEVVSGKFTEKIGKYIFTGDENLTLRSTENNNYQYAFYYDFGYSDSSYASNLYLIKSKCSHFSADGTINNPKINYYRLMSNAGWSPINQRVDFTVDIDNVNDFKQWLKDQYDAGTPVTIYYELETPQTYQLTTTNIPLYENINHISLVNDVNTNTSITYLTNSKFNSLYATKAELKITADSIISEVNKKVSTDDFTTQVSELDSKITQTADNIKSEVKATYSTKSETTQAKNDAISSANSATDNKLKSYSTTTQMNSAINQKADEITTSVSKTYSTKTETQEAIDNINVGGRNYVKNSGPTTIDNWVKLNNNIALSLVDCTSSPTGKAIRGTIATVPSGQTGFYKSIISGLVKNGETYTISAYIRASKNCQIAFTNELFGTHNINLTTNWQKFVYSHTVNTNNRNACIFYIAPSQITAGMWYEVHSLKLEEGNKATDWTPAPEDVQSDIDNVSSTLTEKVEELDSKFTVSTNEISASVSSKTTELSKKIDDVNNNLSNYAKEDVVNQKFSQVESRITSSDAQLTILSETIEKGATKVQTSTGFTFDETGLNIGSTESKVNNTLTPNGMEIEDNSTGDTLLYAGYDTSSNETIVKTKNLTVEKYLVAPKLRIESFKNPHVNKTGTGFFHVE